MTRRIEAYAWWLLAMAGKRHASADPQPGWYKMLDRGRFLPVRIRWNNGNGLLCFVKGVPSKSAAIWHRLTAIPVSEFQAIARNTR